VAPIVFAPLPHTGSEFFRRLFQDNGFPLALTLDEALAGKQWVRQEFPDLGSGTEQLDRLLAARPDAVAVTTIRDWSKVEATWRARGSNMRFLSDRYFPGWLDFMQKHDPVIVSVDSHREARLARLSAVLGIELATDWTPVNATADLPRHNHTFKLPGMVA
jgi:hypothetical protein